MHVGSSVARVLIFLSYISYCKCVLLLHDKFLTLDNWQLDFEGSSASVTLAKRDVYNESRSVMSAKVSYCGEDRCNRAEISLPSSQHEHIFQLPGEYWIGFDMRIPEDWKWLGGRKKAGSSDTTYFMRIHGEDNSNRSPILGFRSMGIDASVNICGNEEHSSPAESCVYESLGSTPIGEWTSWVMHVNFTSVQRDGFLRIWKNNKMVLSRNNLLTAYIDQISPYLKLGAYQLNWKWQDPPLTQWVGYEFAEIRVGNSSSHYNDIYTGQGLSHPDSGGANSSSQSNWIDSLSVLQIVLIALSFIWVLCLAYCFFCGRRSWRGFRRRQTMTHGPEKPMDTTAYSIPYFSRPNRGQGGLIDGTGVTMPNRRHWRGGIVGSLSSIGGMEGEGEDDDSDTPSELAARAALQQLTYLNTQRNSRVGAAGLLGGASGKTNGAVGREGGSQRNPLQDVSGLFHVDLSPHAPPTPASSQEALHKRLSALNSHPRPHPLATRPAHTHSPSVTAKTTMPISHHQQAAGMGHRAQGWSEVRPLECTRGGSASAITSPRRLGRVTIQEPGPHEGGGMSIVLPWCVHCM